MPFPNLGKRKPTDILCCLAAAAVCALLFWLHASAGDDAMRVLLYPHARAAEAFYHIRLPYVNGLGYACPSGAFAIGRECSGVHFIALCFCMNVCMFIHRFKGYRKALWFAGSLAGSALAGVAVTCIRVVGAIPFAGYEKFATIHTGSGVALYLLALGAVYAAVKKLLEVHKPCKN